MLKNQTDRMEAGFSLNNRPKRDENNPGSHLALKYRIFPDIQLHFMSVRPLLLFSFPFFHCLSHTLIDAFQHKNRY